MQDTLFRNARVVLRYQVLHGDIRIEDGRIAAIEEGSSQGSAGEDMEGDWLLPGLVELHTDHLETHYAPRPGVRLNPVAAVQAHDAQIACSGITTVFDALRVGMDEDANLRSDDMRRLADAIEEGAARDWLRADHYIHLRCEVSAPDVLHGFRLFENDDRVRLASMMDHTPGQRQFISLETYRSYYQRKTGMSDDAFAEFVSKRLGQSAEWSDRNREELAGICNARGIALASHDDATVAHVAEAVEHHVRVAEFPTTLEAAHACRDAGLSVLMGGPNIVRGGSHSGNVSARALAEKGLLDIISSDYVPLSMLHGAFKLAEMVEAISLPQAIAMVSANPAEAGGFEDRGEIAVGRRADLVRVRVDSDIPMVRSVWREGRRVA
ncbi:alpha-D-ribose 1-methylphosphonate 5-triphosphate diphosphatase [Faunimonas pinastri]|uniref:Alpha-D-ribose 1-methylphosphonate 5-triphosphate diphosphatase n=2 Tax=Faunimonas pinastri TaxID=1855383 RepID=A0A1H9L8S8_9HYPH|nr:alpha-D-ribose 1-methylphosphonate 5-triphosphate diphosphatase [Faunimonas pinastri]